MTTVSSWVDPRGGTFRHEALVYDGADGFLDAVTRFVRDGVEADEDVLVAVDADKIERLRTALGPAADAVGFIDMRSIGGNPARIIPAWRDFVTASTAAGRVSRGVGEPVWPGRTATELEECHLHESLLNLAFDGGPPFWLICPYDASGLDPAVIEEAGRTHPFYRRSGEPVSSDAYLGAGGPSSWFEQPLDEPSEPVETVPFDLGSLSGLRASVGAAATRSGLDELRTSDLVLAVNEVATNSLRYGGGNGSLRMWRDDDTLICEVADGGTISDPLVGRSMPAPDGVTGRGLWIVNQLCDLAQVRSVAGDVIVRLHMSIPDPVPAAT